MNKQQQQDFFDAFVQKQMNTMLKKGDDYSDEDRLSNFKYVAAIVGITVPQVVLVLAAVKIARLGQLLKPGAVPNNESTDDSVLDGANYHALMAMVLHEISNSVPDEPKGTPLALRPQTWEEAEKLGMSWADWQTMLWRMSNEK